MVGFYLKDVDTNYSYGFIIHFIDIEEFEEWMDNEKNYALIDTFVRLLETIHGIHDMYVHDKSRSKEIGFNVYEAERIETCLEHWKSFWNKQGKFIY